MFSNWSDGLRKIFLAIAQLINELLHHQSVILDRFGKFGNLVLVLFLDHLNIPKAHKGNTNRKSDLRDNVKNGLNVNSLSPPLNGILLSLYHTRAICQLTKDTNVL
nr:MAG TPA: hypothetical protein [Caudoviricetes sp.]